jgi:hypothetical protein
MPIECDEDMENLNNFCLNCLELYLNVISSNMPMRTVIESEHIGGDLIPRSSIGSSPQVEHESQVADATQVPPGDQTTQDNPIALLLSNIPMTDVASDPFEDIVPYENIDPIEDIGEEQLDEGSSSDGFDEVDEGEDDEHSGHEDDGVDNNEAGPSNCPENLPLYEAGPSNCPENLPLYEAGPSNCPGNLPLYVVPSVYTHLDMEAIARNTASFSGFNENNSIWNPKQEFRKGLCFNDKKAFVNAVKLYSMEMQREYKVKLSNTKAWVAKCRQGQATCRWHIRARDVQSISMWKVVSYFGPHECFNESDSSKVGHGNLDCNLIAQLVKKKVKTMPSYAIAAIIEDVKEKYNYTPSYRQCWQAKQKAMSMVYGDWDESYSLLPRWLLAISQFCPRSIVDIKGTPTNKPNKALFDRAFWSFRPCLDAFMHCPPLLCIDATFLYGKYKEYLMIATTVDGNCQILPIAFALVKSESQDTWGWFLGCLLDIAKERNERITLISDRHPGKYIYK